MKRRHRDTIIRRLLACAVFWGAVSAPQPARTGDTAAAPGRSRVALLRHYDVSNPQVILRQMISPGVGKDGIPALTDPPLERASDARFPPAESRVAVVEIEGETVAYPLLILNFHEVVNHTVAGLPIAVFYCPLCDSVSVVDRRLPPAEDGGDGARGPVFEFGVSGLLINSNVVLYDRQTLSLWSQVYARALTGPHAGATLRHLPFRMMTFGQFRERYPHGRVLSRETGHARPYASNPYASYFENDRVYHRFQHSRALPPKTLGLGLHEDGRALFVTLRRAQAGRVTVEMPSGLVEIEGGEHGLSVLSAPGEVQTVQTFFHSWSAFFPTTQIAAAPDEGPHRR